jgi:Flp pilus assembly protein TadD
MFSDTRPGQHDEAIERYRRVLAVTPNEPVSLNNLAYALAIHKKKPADALPLAQKAYLAAGRNPAVADTLGSIHYLLDNHTEAEKVLTEAAASAPYNADIHLHLALTYAALGKPEPALTALTRSLQLDPKLAGRDDVKKLQTQLASRRQ